MPSINLLDKIKNRKPLNLSYRRTYRRVELAARGFAWVWLVSQPLSLALLAVTGELLRDPAPTPGLAGYAGLKAFHYLAGFIWGAGVAYGLVFVLAGAGTPGRLAQWRLLLRSWREGMNLSWVYFAVSVVMAASGLMMLLRLRYGLVAAPWPSHAVWALIHHLAVPLLYALLLVYMLGLLRRAVPSIKAYLYSH